MLKSNNKNGFFILEALVAIIIFAVGILGMVKLQYLSAKYSQQAIIKSQVSFILDEFLSDAALAPSSSSLLQTKVQSKIDAVVSPIYDIRYFNYDSANNKAQVELINNSNSKDTFIVYMKGITL